MFFLSKQHQELALAWTNFAMTTASASMAMVAASARLSTAQAAVSLAEPRRTRSASHSAEFQGLPLPVAMSLSLAQAGFEAWQAALEAAVPPRKQAPPVMPLWWTAFMDPDSIRPVRQEAPPASMPRGAYLH
jgi:hypothetical protein